jgi:hypothetical protein
MLDLGPNVDSKPEALLEFAIMGAIAVEYTENIASPTVGVPSPCTFSSLLTNWKPQTKSVK